MGFVIVATEIQRADRPSSVSEKLSGRNAPRPFIRSDKRNDFSLQSAASSRERGRSEEISNRNYYLLFALIEGGRGQPRSVHSNPGTNDPRICLRSDVKCIFHSHVSHHRVHRRPQISQGSFENHTREKIISSDRFSRKIKIRWL